MKRRMIAVQCGVMLVAALAWTGCGKLTERRIAGEWETEGTPKRTLILRDDGTYLERLSGNTLGFLSNVFGPEEGRWEVQAGGLVLTRRAGGGEEHTRRLPIDGLSASSMSLAGERWVRNR